MVRWTPSTNWTLAVLEILAPAFISGLFQVIVYFGGWVLFWRVEQVFLDMFSASPVRLSIVATLFVLWLELSTLVIVRWVANRGRVGVVWVHTLLYVGGMLMAAGLVVVNGARFIAAHPESFPPAVTDLASDLGAGVLLMGVGGAYLYSRVGSPAYLHELLKTARRVADRQAANRRELLQDIKEYHDTR